MDIPKGRIRRGGLANGEWAAKGYGVRQLAAATLQLAGTATHFPAQTRPRRWRRRRRRIFGFCDPIAVRLRTSHVIASVLQ